MNLHFVDSRNRHKWSTATSSSSSLGKTTLSTSDIEAIVEKLSAEQYRDSTRHTYHRIWKLFNRFFIRLDFKPKNWEQRLILFTGYLVNEGLKSSTVKTYISAIREVLRELRIPISQDNYLISSLTKACRLKNDVVVQRFPIHKGVLKLLLTELSNLYAGTRDQQPYLESLYKAIYSTAYYSLLRIGEIAKSQHVILARNTHIGENKDKILFILITSKTHGKGDRPQKIKIARTPIRTHLVRSEPCPFGLLHKYISIRPPAIND